VYDCVSADMHKGGGSNPRGQLNVKNVTEVLAQARCFKRDVITFSSFRL
jgi:hypothetical protein